MTRSGTTLVLMPPLISPTVSDGEPFPVRAGDTIYIPRAIFHATINTGWTPLRLLAIYNPGGPEQALRELPDFREVPAGQAPGWSRS